MDACYSQFFNGVFTRWLFDEFLAGHKADLSNALCRLLDGPREHGMNYVDR